ncbi:MAG: DUF4249 family protein [Bacteroidales bacterium]|nr:DUF4249 family protein [Bacteroidales bacterium]
MLIDGSEVSMSDSKFVFLVALLCAAIAATSCYKEVQSEFPDIVPVPTVNAILVDGQIITVHVSFAMKPGGETILPVCDNVQILLYENDILTDTLIYTADTLLINSGGYAYYSDVVAKAGNNYSCIITIKDYDTIFCSTEIPYPTMITDARGFHHAGVDQEGTVYPAVEYSFENNPLEKQYYSIVPKGVADEKIGILDIVYIDDPVLLNEGLPIGVFSNNIIEGNSYTMKLNVISGSSESSNGVWFYSIPPVVLELRSITKDYYDFLQRYYLYEQAAFNYEIFIGSMPAHNMYSNVENAYGLFTGYSYSISDTITISYFN